VGPKNLIISKLAQHKHTLKISYQSAHKLFELSCAQTHKQNHIIFRLCRG